MKTSQGSKVGRSHNVYKRFCSLRSQGAQEIVRVWHRPNDAALIELIATRDMPISSLFSAAKGHEWFDVPPERLVERVERAIRIVDTGVRSFYTRNLCRS